MSLEQMQLEFDCGSDHLSFVLQEKKEADNESIQINGKPFEIQGKPAHVTRLREMLPGLASQTDLSAFELRQLLSQIEEVSGLTVASSLSVSDRTMQMNSFIQAMIEQEGFRGAVLVKNRGKRLVYKGFGDADESGKQNTVQTRFCIGSITKQFTGAAITLLIQEGKLSLDDEINSLFPDQYQTSKWGGITVRHLLTMSSGIHNVGPAMDDVKRSTVYSLKEVIAEFLDADLRFDPGAMYEYCNSGYILLGVIIEECSNQSYQEFLKTRIFDRFGMKNTGLFSSFRAEDQARGFYLGDEGKRKSIDPKEMAIHCSKAHAAGGLVSSLEDMEKWDEALYDDAFLTPESRREITDAGDGRIVYDPTRWAYECDAQGKAKIREGVTYDRARYGSGFFIDGDGEILYHGGQVSGCVAFLVRNTITRDCVVVLSNQNFNNSPDCAPLSEMMASHLWEVLQR